MTKISSVIVAVIVVAIVALVMYVKSFAPEYKWTVDYSRQSEQPYGAKYFYDLLKKEKNAITLVNNYSLEKLDTNQTNGNFISLTSFFDIDSAGVDNLLNYVSKGNKALIISNDAPMDLIASFVPVTDTFDAYTSYDYEKVFLSFNNPLKNQKKVLAFLHREYKSFKPTSWTGYSRRYFDDVISRYRFRDVSTINDSLVNCFYVPCGDGAVIIHASPDLFTNYHLRSENGFAHMQKILSLMNNGPIYWSDNNYSDTEDNGSGSSNPIRFLFSHPGLKAGWYVFLFAVLLYLVFRSKREQRIIPVIYRNKNASVEFAKAVGSLYYRKKQHHSIVNELYLVFLYDIRTRYNIPTTISQPELIDKLVLYTKLDKGYFEDLFEQFKNHKNSIYTSAQDLALIYNKLELFYNLKKHNGKH